MVVSPVAVGTFVQLECHKVSHCLTWDLVQLGLGITYQCLDICIHKFMWSHVEVYSGSTSSLECLPITRSLSCACSLTITVYTTHSYYESSIVLQTTLSFVFGSRSPDKQVRRCILVSDGHDLGDYKKKQYSEASGYLLHSLTGAHVIQSEFG